MPHGKGKTPAKAKRQPPIKKKKKPVMKKRLPGKSRRSGAY